MKVTPQMTALLARRDDARFVAGLAVGLRRDARRHDPGSHEAVVRAEVASGTLDAMLWVLGITDLAPATGEIRTERSDAVIAAEAELAELLRRQDPDGADALYLGGVADALEFVLGERRRFWWVPVPERLRPGRDEFGRAVA